MMIAERLRRPTALRASLLAGAALALAAPPSSAQDDGAPRVAYREWDGKPDPRVVGGPGQAQPDLFHPDNQADANGERPGVPPARPGGRAIVHISTLPRHINYMTENSSWVRWIQWASHEWLLAWNFDTWEHEPRLAKGWVREDTVVLKDGERLFGEARADGEGGWVLKPLTDDNPLGEERRLAEAEVDRVLPGTVFTMDLREEVEWQDGKPFDSSDVYFSWRCYFNPTVDCDDARNKVQKITDVEVLGPHRMRFFFSEPYFLALDSFIDLTILPSHVYNLSDPENPAYAQDADVLGERQGTFINEHPANKLWIGLGPYRITSFTEQAIEAKHVPREKYFAPARYGHVDTIRYRHIDGDDASKAALLNGQLDFYMRLRSEDYFGEFCQKEEFTDHYYAGYMYQPRSQVLNWNMRRPIFRDVAVRKALAHCMDWDEFLKTMANGLGVRITGPEFYLSPYYDHSVEPIPFDLDAARDLLDDAGWYDRDGDEIRDKNGVPLEFEFLMTPGNVATKNIAIALQANLGKVGGKVNISTHDWAAMIERAKQKDFDAFGINWVLDPENDPYQLWHSYEGPPGQDRGSNYPGLKDAEIDRLIEEIQVELDKERRIELFHRLHQRLHELQPVMFEYLVPIKFAMSRRIRNFKQYGLNPGFDVRDWFILEPDQAAEWLREQARGK